ncbi:hypothetical protein BB560_003742 [Smittium megazygosporum]|uniref:PPM-type phosphatase domain-containing protein n=1 Tax=Smittium megazygosporum TaxID=133381 RepID=A0A2T9ZB46_9FUNG|nr:hypothetical protein BB560_003742 [Smittium megazygosporum]
MNKHLFLIQHASKRLWSVSARVHSSKSLSTSCIHTRSLINNSPIHPQNPSRLQYNAPLKSLIRSASISSKTSKLASTEHVEPVPNFMQKPVLEYPQYVTYTEEGTIRVDIRKFPQTIGTATARGTRGYNQDRISFRPLRIPSMVFDKKDTTSAQVIGFSVFDGHGGENCSQYLQDHLLSQIELISHTELFQIVNSYRSLGEPWRDYTPQALAYMLRTFENERRLQNRLTLRERLTLAYLKTDLMICKNDWSLKQGSTACTILMWDPEGLPFWSKDSNVHIMVANCGDSRAILCDTVDGGIAHPLSNDHRPSLLSERQRLEKYGTMFTIDSYGEERVMSMVANTRAFGDWSLKSFGIVAEPELNSLTISGSEAAFFVIVCDGITDVMTDQEIVDVVKGSKSAKHASEKLVSTAEQLNASDNISAVVVRLPGWENRNLKDITREFRLERIKNNESMKSQRESFFSFINSSPVSLSTEQSKSIRLVSSKPLIQSIFFNSAKHFAISPSKKLRIAEIQARLNSLRVQLTMCTEVEDLDFGDGITDYGDILPVNEVIRLTLNVLGKSTPESNKTSPESNKASSTSAMGTLLPPSQQNSSLLDFSDSPIVFRSRPKNSFLDIELSLEEVSRAWKLLGLSEVKLQ